jgi:hypothetical protein
MPPGPHPRQDAIIGLALLVALTAVAVGAAAVLASGFTAGQYTRDLVLLTFALAALAYARGPDIRERTRRPDPEPVGTTYTRTG